MALSKTITFSGPAFIQGSEATVSIGETSTELDAYIKVETVTGSKESVSASVSFSGSDSRFVRNYSFFPSLDGPNFIKQAYEYLKTLPEFADATDC